VGLARQIRTERAGCRSVLGSQFLLEGILQRKLQESSVRGVVLEELRSSDLSAVRVVVLGGRVAERRVVQEVERIRAELQILLTERGEVFEDRHVDAVVAGTVDRV